MAKAPAKQPTPRKQRKAAKPPTEKRPPGRPSKYTPAMVEAICERLSKGEALAVICRDEGMPAYRTVKDWQDEQSERGQFVSAAIARAREEGFDTIARRARLTARGKGEEDGGDSAGDVQRDKLIIDTDLKLLAKWDPKRYGDRVQHANDPDNPMPAPQWIVQPVAPK